MNLILRAAAVGDLAAIFDYGVTAHGADAAVVYVKSIEAVMDRLRAHPALGAPRKIRPRLHSISAGEQCIFYRIEGEAIIVARALRNFSIVVE